MAKSLGQLLECLLRHEYRRHKVSTVNKNASMDIGLLRSMRGNILSAAIASSVGCIFMKMIMLRASSFLLF